MSKLGKQVGEAKTFGQGSYIQDGDYLFAVERFFEQDGYNGVSVILELRVLEASQIDPQVKPNAVGSTASQAMNVTKNKEAALSNIKFAIAGVTGCEPDAVTMDVYDQMIADDQPLRGMLVRCRTAKVQNKGKVNPQNAGKILTVPRWTTVEQTDEQIAEMRAKLDAEAKAPASAAASAQSAPPMANAPKPAGALARFSRR